MFALKPQETCKKTLQVYFFDFNLKDKLCHPNWRPKIKLVCQRSRKYYSFSTKIICQADSLHVT